MQFWPDWYYSYKKLSNWHSNLWTKTYNWDSQSLSKYDILKWPVEVSYKLAPTLTEVEHIHLFV